MNDATCFCTIRHRDTVSKCQVIAFSSFSCMHMLYKMESSDLRVWDFSHLVNATIIVILTELNNQVPALIAIIVVTS